MRKILLFFAISGIVLFFGCALNEKKLQETGAKLLTQQDLIEFFKVKRVGTYQIQQWHGITHYYPNGTVEATVVEEGALADKGEYRIENGQFCLKYRVIWEGKESCRRVYHSGKNKYDWVRLDGSHILSMTLK